MIKRFLLLTAVIFAPTSMSADNECPRNTSENQRFWRNIADYQRITCKRASRGPLARIFPIETLLGPSPKTLLTKINQYSEKKFSERKRVTLVPLGLLGCSGVALILPSSYFMQKYGLFRHNPPRHPRETLAVLGFIYGMGALFGAALLLAMKPSQFIDSSNDVLKNNGTVDMQEMINLADEIGHGLDWSNYKTTISLAKAAMTLEEKIARSDRMRLALAAAATLALTATSAIALYKYFKQDTTQDTIES